MSNHGRAIQISAFVSPGTKEMLEKLVRSTGLKKGYVVEMALRHHLQALQSLPPDVIVSPRLTVSRRSGEEIAKRLAEPKPPTRDLRDLMSSDGH